MITSDTPNTDLPNDIPTLHHMVQQLLSNVNEQARLIVDLQAQLEWFKRHTFGCRSEKLDANQLTLFQPVADTEQQEEDTSERSNAVPGSTPKKRTNHRNGRRPLPAHLPRERIEHHPSKEELICSCCGETKQVMGEEITEIKLPEEDELTAGMLKAMDRAEGNRAGTMELISELSNIEVTAIEKMSWGDFQRASAEVNKYLGNAEGGKTQ